MQKRKGRNKKIIAVVVIAVLVWGIWAMTKSASKKEIRNYLEDSPFYSYETSITSDLNEEEKADVYSTSRSIEMAAKDIINAIDGETEDVQENTEDESVAILTEHEYCLVYESEEGKTMVQASSRAYVYQSTNDPYHARATTSRHYRNFYYFRGFSRDASRYNNRASGYQNYDGTAPEYNYSDTYRTYSNTVRQGSAGTRTSSGGGIGFGK